MKTLHIPLLAVLGLSPAVAQTTPTQATPTQTAPALTVEVLDHRVLPMTEVDGLKFAELSALAHDAEHDALYGVSDKGGLFRIGFAQDNGTITELAPQAGWRFLDAEGAAMRGRDFNPEGAHLRRDGGLLVVSESGPSAALFDLEGNWQQQVDLPAALRDPTLQRSDKDGLESLAEHPTHGLLSATEEPQAADDRAHHTIHAGDGRRFSWDTTDIGKTNVKALTLDDAGRLLILERHRVTDSDQLMPYLRLLDPAACAEGADCPTSKAAFSLPGFENADFEGMTALGDDLYLLVSDDKIDGAQRAVFALLRVTVD